MSFTGLSKLLLITSVLFIEPSILRSEPPAMSRSTPQPVLVNTTDTSQWSPPSPDPAGITYLGSSGTLLVADPEVDEMPMYFTGDNLFEMRLSGNLTQTLTTISFSDEPTGVAYNPANDHVFFSDDSWHRIYEMNPGADGRYDTPDDVITSFRTGAFGASDPQGVTFDSNQGVLFIADGMNNAVYRVTPGANGVFDGAPPDGDDQVTHFDTAILGIMDPEGIAYNWDDPSLYLVGNPSTSLAHITTDGTLLRLMDISSVLPVNPGGLAYAPSSQNPAEMNLYVADQRIDNDSDPVENDGKVYELSIPTLTPGNKPPRVDAGPDQTVTLPDIALLNGTVVADDGVPIEAATTWSRVSGPGSVVFADANAVDTTATFTLPGTYILRLTADDGELMGYDEVTIQVRLQVYLPVIFLVDCVASNESKGSSVICW